MPKKAEDIPEAPMEVQNGDPGHLKLWEAIWENRTSCRVGMGEIKVELRWIGALILLGIGGLIAGNFL